jgi:hypothetical protein
MKRILAVLGLLLSTIPVFAQATTPNIFLQVPAFGDPGWQSSVNYNFYQLDLFLSAQLPIPSISVTGTASLPGLTTWITSTNYASGAIVFYNGLLYTSVVGSNQGNLPTNTNFWTPGVGGQSGNVVIPATTSVIKGTGTVGVSTSAVQADFFLIEYLSFSGTPTFSPTYSTSQIQLSGNITSFTMPAGGNGQQKCLAFQHDSSATAYTVTAPGNVRGFFKVGTTANLFSQQCFTYFTFNSLWLAQSAGVINQ